MRRVSVILFCIIAACACSKQAPEVAIGKVSLNISTETDSFTKADIREAPNDFIVLTLDAEGNTIENASGTYAEVKGTFEIYSGSYTTSAYNITKDEAVQDWGAIRYAGSQEYTVTAGGTSVVSFRCTMANAQVSISYDHTFTDQFSEYAVDAYNTLSRSRTFPAEATFDSPIAFYNVEDGDLLLIIKGVKDEQYCEFHKTISITPATSHKITIKALTIQGEAGFTVTAEDEITTLDSNVTVDPYKN